MGEMSEHRDLSDARTAFNEILANEPTDRRTARPLRELAGAGIARLDYIAARSANFSTASCTALSENVRASYQRNEYVPINMVWRADCLRKTGQSATALGAFGSALHQLNNNENVALQRGDVGALSTAALAYEGLGTTIISTSQEGAQNASVAGGLAHARTYCARGPAAAASDGDNRLALARQCIQRAMETRRQLRQTEIEIAGAEQVVGIALLREHKFDDALAHAQRIDAAAPYAWNTAVRWIAARSASNEAETADALDEARIFPRASFNECELRPLLGDEYAQALDDLLQQTREGETAAQCAAA